MFLKRPLQLNKIRLTVIYKLLYDVFFIGLLFFFLAMIVEGILPGVISTRIGFSRVIVFLFIVLAIIYFLGSYLNIKLNNKKVSKKTAVFGLILAVLLILNSLVGINIYLAILMTLITLAAGYYIYRNLSEKEEMDL